jgi:hypothetical protein
MDVSKAVFFTLVAIVAMAGAMLFGMHSGAHKNALFQTTNAIKTRVVTDVSLFFDNASTLAGIRPEHFLQRSRHEGDGVTLNDAQDQDSLVLLSGFFEAGNQLRLVRRDGSIVAKWPVVFSEIFPDASHLDKPPTTDWNIETHGALLLEDGSAVFNFEYGGLAKLDRCGDVVWTLAHPTHHSVERAVGGGFWVPGRRHYPEGSESPMAPFPVPVDEDLVLKVSDDGEILQQLSVPRLMYDNGMEAVLTSSGHPFRSLAKGEPFQWDREIVHLNKIAELTPELAGDFPTFDAGDLVLSLARYNLVLVFNPESEQVKWWSIGPWLRQHDPEFQPGGRIVLFNNNIYQSAYAQRKHAGDIADLPRSNIISFDPATGRHEIAYGGKSDQEFLSVVRGKVDLTPRGGFLITEFEAGRVLEVDSQGRLVWEYINRFNDEEVAEITEARLYPLEYFNVSDWACPGKSNQS